MNNKQKLKLFVWTDFSSDYTSGLAFALAHDESEARSLIIEERGYEPYDWGNLHIFRADQRIAFSVVGGG